MKKIFFPFLVMPLIALCFSMSIHAQSSERDLDQVELMKQFVGFWKHDAGKDSVIIIWDVKPFGKGYELHMKRMYKEETKYEIKDLWGFDSKSETWITFSLRSRGGYSTYYGKFISNNEFYWDEFDITNPEKILGRFNVDFTKPDKFTLIGIIDGKESFVWTFYRIKE